MISTLVVRLEMKSKKDSMRYVFDTNVLDMNMNERIRPSTIASSAHNDSAVR